MPLNPDIAVLQRRIAHDAAYNLSARRNRISRRYENRSLADPQEERGYSIAHADLLVEDPVVLLYVAAILAQRLNLANEAIIELKSELGRQRALSS